MSLRKSIAQHVFWRGLYLLSVFALNILLSRSLKANYSGSIYYTINNLSLLLMITGISLESGATFYASKKQMDRTGIGGLCFLWAVIATVISTFVLWRAPGLAAGRADISGEHFIAWCGYVFGFLLINYFSALFFSRQNFLAPNIALFGVTCLTIAGVALFGSRPFFQQHFIFIYFLTFPFQGLLLVLTYFYGGGEKQLVYWPTGPQIKKIFSYSAVALCANIVFFLVYRVDYWFVRKYCSDHDLGNYIQVSKIGQIFLVVPTMFATIIFPNTAGGTGQQMKSSLPSLSRALFVVYLAMVAVLALAGAWFFPFLYGPTFDQMYPAFLLLGPGILALSILSLLAAYFAGINRLSVNLAGAAIALVVIVCGDLALVPVYGIRAAAGVSSAGYFVYLLYELWMFRKMHPTGTLNFFIPVRSDRALIKGLFSKKMVG